MSAATLLDKAIGFFSPAAGLRRAALRLEAERLSSYEAGVKDRRMARWLAKGEAGDSPNLYQIQNARYRAWDLYRNNPHVRKITRTLIAKVVGKSMAPEPLAETINEEPDDRLRGQIADQWRRWSMFPALTGEPGKGGQDWLGLCEIILREVILSGEILIRFRKLSASRANAEGRALPMAIELIECERLAEDQTSLSSPRDGATIFRGVELDADGKRIGYWIYDQNPNHPAAIASARQQAVFIPAADILHLYVADRPSQIRGVTWLAPILLQLRDIADYQENELMASMVSAAVALVVKVNPGSGAIGLRPAAGSASGSADRDGNPITHIQPGTVIRLAPGEEANSHNPLRPGGQVEPFCNHLVRVASTGIPGVKASTLTGDYRNSSFSSERSADNDNWPETEQVQHWFAQSFCQPTYEAFLMVAILSQKFDNRIDFSDLDRIAKAAWSAPSQRSINPIDDVTAAAMKTQFGLSSPIAEAGALGRNWRQVLRDVKKVIDEATELGLPQAYIDNLIGVTTQPVIAAPPPSDANGRQGDQGQPPMSALMRLAVARSESRREEQYA